VEFGFDGFPQILEEMPAVGDLDGVRGPPGDAALRGRFFIRC